MRKINRLIAIVLIVTIVFQTNLFFSGYPSSVIKAAESLSLDELYDIYMSSDNIPDTDYQKYLGKHAKEFFTGDTSTYTAESLHSGDIILKESQEVELSVDVAESAVYVLSFDYKTLGNNILPTKMALKVNGSHPYDELKRLFVSDTWVSGETQYDRHGNECIAMPLKKDVWEISYLHDIAFLFSQPMMIYLEEGNNTLTFKASEGSVQLGNLYLSAQIKLSEDSTQAAAGDGFKIIEAEDITYRNSPNIRSEAEYITDITPYSPKLKVLNMVSEASFKTGGTKIEYEFEADVDGYYNLAFDYRQSTKSDFSVYRNIYIDGVIPSQSFGNMAFGYSKKYTRTTVPAAVYLTKGTHLLSIEVTLDNMRNSINILNVITDEINALALSVNKITGGNTDKYRDFDLDNFYVMFYRTDILDALGLKVPNTMDEVREMLPELARMGLSFNTHVANYPAKTFATTTPFIFQSGGVLMKDGEITANLDSPEVISGMKYLTENFTIYDMDYEVLSFYQAFRDGRMPIGISDYNTFNLLINAAPELADSWAIAPYPGIENEDTKISNH